jgi:DNA-binding GntR family transcriptional regulator
MQMNAILPLAILNSQEKAYQHLKQAILDHEFRPNERLRAQEIAEKLKISRTPVREALSRLEQEGFVIRSGGWGYVVKPITEKEAMDIYHVRRALEIEAVKEVIPKIDAEMLSRLRGCLKKAEDKLKQGKTGEYRSHTRAFYRLLARATENSCLEHMMALIDDRVRWLGAMITEKNTQRPRESLKGNWEILRAIESQDIAAAETAVRKHVAGAQNSFIAYVRSGEDLNVA